MPNQHSRPKRILIVDDEPTLVFFLKQGLQDAPGAYLVDGASSGEEALTKLTYNLYDLLITDLKMPGISGFTLVEVARSLHPNISVILMTAYGSREVQDESEQLEVNGYLIKPFPTIQLQEMIEEIFLASGSPSPNLVTEQNLPPFSAR
ncbi:MAG: response regulator [Anaerolineae bacterium]|nr:response regulator [Anaerolineae bacterium]